MRKLTLVITALFALNVTSFAQTYFIVNSEQIFKSLSAYTKAIETLDELEGTYQDNIDKAYQTIEEQYNTYKQQAAYLSDAERTAKENQIIENEKKITEYTETTLGDNGELMKKRIELIQPIQDKVFTVINNYATTNNISMVIDVATTPSVVYYNPSLDKTNAIIELLKAQ
ncbi:MAG: OmpH family outer membrane protein [Rikenellaceae bacterium]